MSIGHSNVHSSIRQTEMSIGHSYVYLSSDRTEMSIGHKYMSIGPLDEQKCLLDIQMSIRPMDQLKCPLEILMSIGHFAEVLEINLHLEIKLGKPLWPDMIPDIHLMAHFQLRAMTWVHF